MKRNKLNAMSGAFGQSNKKKTIILENEDSDDDKDNLPLLFKKINIKKL